MKAEVVEPSEVFNILQEDVRLLVIDTRPKSVYSKGHIRRAACVKVAPNGKALEEIAGPGPPIWTKSCWWDRNVVVTVPEEIECSIKRKRNGLTSKSREKPKIGARWQDEDDDEGEAKRRKVEGKGEEEDAVVTYLLKEGLVRTLKILVSSGDSEASNGYAAFAEAYPFLVTKHTKGPAIPRYPAEIVPGLLYLGDWDHAKAESKLGDLKVTHILTAHTEKLPEGESKFTRLFFDLSDEFDANIAQHFAEAHEFVRAARAAGGRVLVHCGAGASRSATLCAAYLMRERSWDAERAVRFLKQQRSKVQPNPGFLRALKAYERTLEADSGGDHKGPGGGGGQAGGRERAPPSARANQRRPSGSAAADPEGLRLEVWKGEERVSDILLEAKETLVIGRLPTCDITLDHASISRQHAKLSHEGGSNPELEDLGASHGTRVDGKRLKPSEKRKLEEGNKIVFGASTRSYSVRGVRSSASRWEGEADV